MRLSIGSKARLAFQTMGEFTLEDLGDGHFALAGEMSFDTAERILQVSERFKRRD